MKKKQFKNREENKSDSNSTDTHFVVPKEIDTHYKLYGKHSWEVKYYEKCEICNSNFDEFGFCACGSVND
jgi:hypothetical protein